MPDLNNDNASLSPEESKPDNWEHYTDWLALILEKRRQSVQKKKKIVSPLLTPEHKTPIFKAETNVFSAYLESSFVSTTHCIIRKISGVDYLTDSSVHCLFWHCPSILVLTNVFCMSRRK